jgi:hypothetical protein
MASSRRVRMSRRGGACIGCRMRIVRVQSFTTCRKAHPSVKRLHVVHQVAGRPPFEQSPGATLGPYASVRGHLGRIATVGAQVTATAVPRFSGSGRVGHAGPDFDSVG